MTDLRCSRCQIVKSESEFYLFNGVPNGKRCKACRRQQDYERRWTPERRAKAAAFRLKGIEGTVCDYLTCDEMQSHDGLCSRHYRERRRGTLNAALVVRFVRLCGAPDCEIEIAKDKWSCKGHANQLRRFGETWPLGHCRDCREPLPKTAGKGRVYCDQCGSHRGRMHGKSRQWFEAKLAEQGHACAMCGTKHPAGRYDGWNIDHDHDCCPGGTSCGECVRDILCYLCNTMLGMAGDDPRKLRAGAEYIERHKSQKASAA